MRLRFKNLGHGLVEVVGTGLVIRRIDHPASGGGHWWSLNDVSLASMQYRVQRLYDAFGRLWVQ